MSDAIQDTLEKLDLVFLPDEAERPLILRFDPSLDPVMELSLSAGGTKYEGEEGLRRLRRIADLQIKRALEPIKGVAAVRVRGGLEEEIEIRIQRDQLRRTGVPIELVISPPARRRTSTSPAARSPKAEPSTWSAPSTSTPASSRSPTRSSRSGSDRPIRIRDLGEVDVEPQGTTDRDPHRGQLSVQMEIFKEADANIVALAERVRARLGEVREPDTQAERRRRAPGRAAAAAGPAGLGTASSSATRAHS